MIIEKLHNGSFVIEPKIFKDDRGYFFESFNQKDFNDSVNIDFNPVQDNESKSSANVFRGLHFQKPPYAQAKLVRVVKGAVFDVAVDLRKDSPTYGKWNGVLLTEENHKQFFIPQGYAHGFIALQDDTIFQYKCDNFYNKESEGSVSIEDAAIVDENGVLLLNVLNDFSTTCGKFLMSEKDKNNKLLKDIDNPF